MKLPTLSPTTELESLLRLGSKIREQTVLALLQSDYACISGYQIWHSFSGNCQALLRKSTRVIKKLLWGIM